MSETRFVFSAFQGRRLHLGVCGSVAAYKALDLVRLAQRHGLQTGVTLTEAGSRFIAPLSFSALGADPVYTRMFGEDQDTAFAHLSPGAVADIFVIAPASADTLARVAHGLADAILPAQALAWPRPLVLAPAMNPRMWKNPATQANLALLRERGHIIVAPLSGVVACGDEGEGRLAPVETILYHALRTFWSASGTDALAGKKVLVTLGPTREPWDKVRYWSNHSTGYMGACLAHAAWLRGARVFALTGPGSAPVPQGVERIEVTTARDMFAAAERLWPDMDVGICTAAVADFAPEPSRQGKFKKKDAPDGLTVAFSANPDILLSLGRRKLSHQKLLGFAAETERLEEQMASKLQAKNADMLVGNLIGVSGSGFASPTNTVAVLDSRGRKECWPELSKPDVAWRLLEWLSTL